MKDKFTRFVKEITVASFVELAKYLLFFIISIIFSYITVDMVAKSFAPLIPYKLYLLGALVALFCLIAIIIYQKSRRFKPLFPQLEFDFYHLEKTVRYEYESPKKITYKRRFKLQALRNGLSTFTDYYHWTGKDKCNLVCESGGHEIRYVRKQNVWQIYEVSLSRTYNKGEVFEVEMRWDLDDVDGKAVPFISATIFDPTEVLVFELSFTPPHSAKKIFGEHSPHMRGGTVFETEELKLTDGSLKWSPPKPQLLHHYEVKWHPYSTN